ncbi:CoA-binding protein [Gemmatimonadota bacterium]
MGGLDELRRILEESGDPGNPTPEEVREIMESVRTIAVVGVSRNPEKAARRVPSYMASKGYEIIPVNPFIDQIFGKEAKDTLAEVVDPVDMVLVFRPSEEAAEIVTSAAARPEHPVIWLQEGIRADAETAEARTQGFKVVQDLCVYKVHRAL